MLSRAPVTRKRWFESLALAAAAAASFATSAPAPDWVQSDEAPPQQLSLRPGEEAALSLYAEGPPSFSASLEFTCDEQAPIELVVTPDGAAEPCTEQTLGLDDWSGLQSDSASSYHRASMHVHSLCFDEGAGGVTVTFRLLSRAPAAADAPPLALDVRFRASAEGDDDERQNPPVRVEVR